MSDNESTRSKCTRCKPFVKLISIVECDVISFKIPNKFMRQVRKCMWLKTWAIDLNAFFKKRKQFVCKWYITSSDIHFTWYNNHLFSCIRQNFAFIMKTLTFFFLLPLSLWLHSLLIKLVRSYKRRWLIKKAFASLLSSQQRTHWSDQHLQSHERINIIVTIARWPFLPLKVNTDVILNW